MGSQRLRSHQNQLQGPSSTEPHRGSACAGPPSPSKCVKGAGWHPAAILPLYSPPASGAWGRRRHTAFHAAIAIACRPKAPRQEDHRQPSHAVSLRVALMGQTGAAQPLGLGWGQLGLCVPEREEDTAV